MTPNSQSVAEKGDPYTQDTIIGSLERYGPGDPLTDGVEIPPDFQIISCFEGVIYED